MAAAPEDGGDQLDAFSPSVFLDLPPTPRSDVGDQEEPAAALPDDLVLPYISRILMEEDVDDKFFYQYPDHPALLQAQQPFAEILSDAACSPPTGSSSSHGAATTDTTASGISSCFTLSPSSSSSSDPAAFADATCWPHDPVELTHHLLTAGAADTNAAAAAAAALPLLLLPGGQEQSAAQKKNRVSMEMLNQAFLKGMEEASKLLPTTSSSRRKKKNRHDDVWDDGGETNRSSKLLAPEPEETGELVDSIVTHGRALCLDQLKRLSITMATTTGDQSKKSSTRSRKSANDDGQGQAVVVDLSTSLLHCAQAVSMDDRRGAAELLRQIKRQSSPTGDANQRLAYCFAEGLEARLAGTGSHLYRSLMVKRTSLVDFLRAYQLYLATTCFNMIAFFFSHMVITNAIIGTKKKKKLHIVDYGVQYGCQWPSLIDALSKHEGGPPEVRMTCIDLPEPGFRPAARVQETGRRLSDFAARCGLPFTFRSVVAARWETVRAEDLDIRPDDEVLVVNSTTRFQSLMDEGGTDDVYGPSPRDVVLGNIRRMKPDVFVLSVVSGSHNSPFFLARFREALFYYSAMFDILDATAPRDNEQRLVVERDLVGRCALNVVACEGADRVERPETYRQWQARSRRAGLRQLPLCADAVQVLSERVRKYYHRDFVVDVDGHWILQGWKGRIFYAMSTWVADDR